MPPIVVKLTFSRAMPRMIPKIILQPTGMNIVTRTNTPIKIARAVTRILTMLQSMIRKATFVKRG
jgi:hypothetical protein